MEKNLGLWILGVIAIIAMIGLVMIFRGGATGEVIITIPGGPNAGEVIVTPGGPAINVPPENVGGRPCNAVQFDPCNSDAQCCPSENLVCGPSNQCVFEL